MKEAMMKEINILRFLLVVAVVLGHSPLRESYFLGGETNILNSYTYSFLITHNLWNDCSILSLFFISGYLFFFNIRNGDNSWYFVKIDKRWISLFVPYLTWNIIWLLYTIAKIYFFSKNGISYDIELNSFSKIVACFWALGQGDMPYFPIAGYSWFLRDLFVFALVSPIYLYVYNRKIIVWLAAILSLFLMSYRVIEPYYNGALFIGGLLGYRKIIMKDYIVRIKWSYILLLIIASFYTFYFWGRNPLAYLIMVYSTFCFLYKFSVLLQNNYLIHSFAAFSTFLYLSHVLVLNCVGKVLCRFFEPRNDIQIICVYYLNFFLTFLICYLFYRILKIQKTGTAFLFLSGGRK